MGKFVDIWDNSKDGKRSEQRSFLRFSIIVTILMALFLCLRKDNVFRWIHAGFVLQEQRREIEELKKENLRLDDRIRMFSTDRDTLERFARETYFFAAPGEDVYIEE